MAEFCSLFSGSSGNCTFIGSGKTAILIDAGASTKSICTALDSIGRNIDQIKAIFITHEHTDHIRGLPVLIKKFKIPVYANTGTIQGILSEYENINTDYIRELPSGETEEVCDLCVSSFKTSHDSKESVGYRVQTEDGKCIAVATDLGYVSDSVLFNITSCQIVMLESNHDIRMLENGKYPYFLKRRILSDKGHLSNDDCADVLPELVSNGAEYIFLAHLSKDNNFPELAVQTSVANLSLNGMKQNKDYRIEAAPRFQPGTLCCI